MVLGGVVHGPGGMVPGGTWSRGLCLVLGGGVPGPGWGGTWSWGGLPGGEPPPRRLLLRAVRILLECILVGKYKFIDTIYGLFVSESYHG